MTHKRATRDVEIIDFLRNLCRLRYSQIMGVLCVVDRSKHLTNRTTTDTYEQLEMEFGGMFNVYDSFVRNPDYVSIPRFCVTASQLVEALHKFHLFTNQANPFDFEFPWPPPSWKLIPNPSEEELKALLLKAIQAGEHYLEDNHFTQMSRPLVFVFGIDPKDKIKPNGLYDFVSTEPIL